MTENELTYKIRHASKSDTFIWNFFHTDPKDFKDGYAASRLRGPHVYHLLLKHVRKYQNVIGEADSREATNL
jgi:hypothetical protein